MASRTPIRANSATAPDRAPIASAVRTLEAEVGGISALSAAMQNGLGDSFLAAVETIRDARGRVIVSGMGKSGHIGHKIAATLPPPARRRSSCIRRRRATAISA